MAKSFSKDLQKVFKKLFGSAQNIHGLIIAKNDDLIRILNRMVTASRDLTQKTFTPDYSVNVTQAAADRGAIASCLGIKYLPHPDIRGQQDLYL